VRGGKGTDSTSPLLPSPKKYGSGEKWEGLKQKSGHSLTKKRGGGEKRRKKENVGETSSEVGEETASD